MKRKHLLTLLVASSLLLTTAPLMSDVILPKGPDPVNLGTAGNFVILSKAGISTTGVTSIVGNIGVSPIDSTSMTGFSLILDSSGRFSTSPQLTGKAYAPDYATPTPSNLTTAIGDIQIAFTDAAGRTLPDFTEMGAGNISGLTLVPGLYKWGSGVLITSGVTLSGSPKDVWIFQISQNLTVENGAIITLAGGALPENIYWQVEGEVTIGTTAQFKGNIICQTAISLRTGASLDGRMLSMTAVSLDSNSVNIPANPEGWSRGAISLENDWMYLNWFGYFNAVSGPVDQWIWHAHLGWLYAVGTSPTNAWFYDPEMGWIWTSDTTFSFIYRADDEAWLYYTPNSSSPRLFLNLNTQT